VKVRDVPPGPKPVSWIGKYVVKITDNLRHGYSAPFVVVSFSWAGYLQGKGGNNECEKFRFSEHKKTWLLIDEISSLGLERGTT
jgi:hypothetical protein